MLRAFLSLLGRWLILALGVAAATSVVRGINCSDWGTMAVVVVILSFLNAFLKPLLVVFTLPFVVLSFGLGLWIINALLLLGAGRLVDGFEVAGFGSALLGSAIISATNFFASRMLARARRPGRQERPPAPRGDVIDI